MECAQGQIVELDSTDIVAIVLSLILPGLGHILLGQRLKGALVLLAVVTSCGIGYLGCVVVALDAYLVARVSKTRPIGDFEVFPEHKRWIGL